MTRTEKTLVAGNILAIAVALFALVHAWRPVYVAAPSNGHRVGAMLTDTMTASAISPRTSSGVSLYADATNLSQVVNNTTITNLDPLSPSVVRFGARVYPLPIAGVNEAAALYARIDPSGADHQLAALYAEISTAQLDTYGPAIKIIHAGGGDGIYIAQVKNATSGGAGMEIASFVDGSKGFMGIDLQTNTITNCSSIGNYTQPFDIGTNGSTQAELNDTVADGSTALLIRRNVGGVYTLQRVTMGTADSGGAGYKVLRVAN